MQPGRVAEERQVIFQRPDGVRARRGSHDVLDGRPKRERFRNRFLQGPIGMIVSGGADRDEHTGTGPVDEHGQPRRDGDVRGDVVSEQPTSGKLRPRRIRVDRWREPVETELGTREAD